jgi:uncharacterized membrane protein YfcA
MFSDIVSHAGLLLSLLAIGGLGGFLSGLLGVGGGIIFVPALFFVMTAYNFGTGVAMHVAVATSLALVLVTGASSAYWHHRKGSVDITIVKTWWPAVVAGVAGGTAFASSVEGALLKQVFAGVALLIAVYMTVSKEPLEGVPVRHKVSLLAQRCGAVFIGGLSALLGVGGAILTIPFMTYIGVPIRKAVGTGGALAFIISRPGIFGYIVAGLQHPEGLPPGSLGYVNLLALAVIVPTSMLLSPVGVNASHRLSRPMLRRIFAIVLVVVSLRMFLS